MDISALIIALLAMVAIGLLFQVLVYPYLSGDARANKRQEAVAGAARSTPTARRGDRAADGDKRRKQIADSLKEVENKGKSKKLSLDARLKQAGLDWDKKRWYMLSAGLAVVFGFVAWEFSDMLLGGVGGAFIGAWGIPNWLLNFIKKRRIKKFVDGFPESVDIIIRGVRAGLPLGDCLRVIASEAREPVRSEFRSIIESTALGLPMAEAVDKLYERVPVQEANFFAIVLNIQSKSGGNLSEALGNLSTVLRERKKMQQKVTAMSQEAKASAGIIGSLPFFVTGALYLTSPHYVELLWITSTGRMIMMGCGFWMFIGIMSMKKMINFDM